MLPCRSLFAFLFPPRALQSHVAMLAPTRIFPETTLGEVLLRAGGEDELLTTVNTQQDFVNKLGFHKSPRQVLWIQYTTPPARALLLHTKRTIARLLNWDTDAKSNRQYLDRVYPLVDNHVNKFFA